MQKTRVVSRVILSALLAFFVAFIPTLNAYASAVGVTTTTTGFAWYVTPTQESAGFDIEASTLRSATSTVITLKQTQPAMTYPSGATVFTVQCSTGSVSGWFFWDPGSSSSSTVTDDSSHDFNIANVPACPSGQSISGGAVIHFVIATNDSAHTIYETFDVSSAAPIIPVCTSFSAAASYTGGTLAVRVTTGSFPSGGFRVDAPDPGTTLPSTRTMSILATDNVEGYAGTYYKSVSLSSLSAMTAKVTGLSSSGATLCSTSITVSGAPISTTPPDTSGADNTAPSSSTSCGFSLNPLSYLKCLFWPDSNATHGWSTRIDTLKTQPPINVVVGGYSFISNAYADIATCETTPIDGSHVCTSGNAWNMQGLHTGFDSPADGTQKSDPLQAASSEMQDTTAGRVVYKLLQIGLWVGFAFLVWHRLASAFGGKD